MKKKRPTDDDHRGRLEDRHGFDDLLLVHLRSRFVDLTNDVGHTGLEADESRQMDRLAGVVLGERLNLAPMALGALLGEES